MKNNSWEVIHGCCEEASAALLTKISIQKTDFGLSVALVSSSEQAQRLAYECATFASWIDPQIGIQALSFKEDPLTNIDANRRDYSSCERLSVLSQLLTKPIRYRLLITTPQALFGTCPIRKTFEAQQIQLQVGDTTSFQALIKRLTQELDYDAEAVCEFPGQIAIRGGLIDIYPCDSQQPYRLDFFGDQLESIRFFDPLTQRSKEPTNKISICAAIRSNESQKDGGLVEFLPISGVHWILLEPAKLVRDYPNHFTQKSPTKKTITTFYELLQSRSEAKERCVALCSLDTDPKLFRSSLRLEISTEATAYYRHQNYRYDERDNYYKSQQDSLHRFESQIADWAKLENLTIVFVCADKDQIKNIGKSLAKNPITAKLQPKYLIGFLSSGFLYRKSNKSKDVANIFPESNNKGFVLICDHEFFNNQKLKSKTRKVPTQLRYSQVDQLLDFSELADGDPLVHLQHGICLFRGLTKLNIQGGTKEVISVEFAANMTIHVPLYESHLLTRYVGLTKSSPKLGKIGGVSWDKTRRAAEIATLDYAAELLNLHARRKQSYGYAFPPDSSLQKTFEDAFIFSETPDQQSAIEQTKQDMERPAPMDRLICGDVGFGKTEVAIRAALKAVLAGKQVALLTPTTILCQQHYNTFCERMSNFPVIVEQVSRFRTTKENRQSLAQLAAGKIDIVVGTHRLLSKDVYFQNLGLLIVDEEQRFGVKQKDSIKQLRAEVDILTLSATPIPRTLYLALSGARSMSVIETAPINRHPIKTIVKSYDPELVKQAIEFEKNRNGQVFYLHNKVTTINAVAQRIRDMLPALKVAVGHGQMEDQALEKVMTEFVAGQFDVLVCTTIIESGIDIPNCNTLIIEGADRFGLAQLYQIRGRVGRFKQQAYAYLLLHRHAPLVSKAQKRLHALKQHDQLGAGFRIAMRDLELRGAGNLLGAQQSGHIAGVGFELYCQLLKQSVARLKGEPGADRIRAEVKLDFIACGEGGGASRSTSGTTNFAAIKAAEYKSLNGIIEACLPTNYIAEPRLRIDFYRRLALAEDSKKIRTISEEIKDRFGKRPVVVDALIELCKIRIAAELAGVRRVESENERLICQYAHPKKDQEFLKIGSRFPRLTAEDPLLRLKEINKFLQRRVSS